MLVAFTIERVEWLDPRAVALRTAMDTETSAVYAARNAALAPSVAARVAEAFAISPSEMVETFIVLDGARPIAHGALRPWQNDALEVKKIFVDASYRGQGVSRVVMAEVERLALARGIRRLILQTGDLQVEAIGLYEAIGYRSIPVYGLYTVLPFAVCFEKLL